MVKYTIRPTALGDIAANLQRQVEELKDGKVNVSDKATEEEAKAGTDDTKWMTPAMSFAQFLGNKATSSEISSASAVDHWVAPDLLGSTYATKTYASSQATSAVTGAHGVKVSGIDVSNQTTNTETITVPGKLNTVAIFAKTRNSYFNPSMAFYFFPIFKLPSDRKLMITHTYNKTTGNYGWSIKNSSGTDLLSRSASTNQQYTLVTGSYASNIVGITLGTNGGFVVDAIPDVLYYGIYILY